MIDLHQTISQIISHVPEEATELIDDLKHCQTPGDVCRVFVDHQVTTDGEEWEATVIDIFMED